MMAYPRYPTRREDDGASPFRVIIGIVIVFLLVIVAGWLFTRNIENHHSATPYPRHDSLGPTYLHDGQSVIRWYVFTDPDTGVQYLVNDRGGTTPRLQKEEGVEKKDD